MTGAAPDPLDRLRQQIAKSRATYVPGTPEKYPGTELRGFTVLEAEALLGEHDALVEVARAARAVLEATPHDLYGSMWAERRAAQDALEAALARPERTP